MEVLSPASRGGCHPHSARDSAWESNLDGIPSRDSAIVQEEGGEGSLMTQDSLKHILQLVMEWPVLLLKPETEVCWTPRTETVTHHPQQPPCTGCGEKVMENLLIITYQGKPRMSSQRTIPHGSFRDAITRREDELCWVALVRG